MNDDNARDRELLTPLREVHFAPDSDDHEFLSTVRHRVTVRRHHRTIRTSVVSSLAVVVLIVAIVNQSNLFGPEYGQLLNEDNMAYLGWTDDELADVTTYYDELFSFDSGEDDLTERISSEMSILFDDDPIYDPVDYLAMYDDEVQEQVLEQLKEFSIFDTPIESPSTGRGEI